MEILQYFTLYFLLKIILFHEYDVVASTTIFLTSTGSTDSIYSSSCLRNLSKFGIDTILNSIPLVFKFLAASITWCNSSPLEITIPSGLRIESKAMYPPFSTSLPLVYSSIGNLFLDNVITDEDGNTIYEGDGTKAYAEISGSYFTITPAGDNDESEGGRTSKLKLGYSNPTNNAQSGGQIELILGAGDDSGNDIFKIV